MTNTGSSAKKLSMSMDSRKFPCTVIILNQCPSDWNVLGETSRDETAVGRVRTLRRDRPQTEGGIGAASAMIVLGNRRLRPRDSRRVLS